MNIKNSFRFSLAVLAAAGVSQSAWAGDSHDCLPQPCETLVVGDAGGLFGSGLSGDCFWGVYFQNGSEGAHIESVTIDLRAGADHNAYFDFDGVTSILGLITISSPSGPEIGSLHGMTSGQVSFSQTTGTPSSLTLTFAEGAFGVGDSIRFGADTDRLGLLDSATDVGLMCVGFTVVFEGGESIQTHYSPTLLTSTAVAKDCETTSVPTPSAAAMGMGLLALASQRRRRSKKD